MVRGMAVATVAGYNPLMVTVGAMKADASDEGPSPWDALWMGEGFPPAPKAPANSPKAREEKADLKACGCGWAKEIKYRAPSEIPVPDSVVAEWKKLPLTDERVINAWKAAYQRREWKAYLRGLSPCARAGLLAWQSRYEESESLRALMEAIAREAGEVRTAEKAEAFAERWARAARDRVLIAAGYDPVLVTLGSGRRMNPSTEDRRRDGPRNEPAGTGSDALVREGKGGEIASSVPAEIRVQNGHSGTWIASSVPAEIRARAQSAYEQAYTRAYRAYLGASPGAGDPTATPRAGACSCPCCCKVCFAPSAGGNIHLVSVDCKTGGVEVISGTGLIAPPDPNKCSCSFTVMVNDTYANAGHSGGGGDYEPSNEECISGQATPVKPGEQCSIHCQGDWWTTTYSAYSVSAVSCNCDGLNIHCIGSALDCATCRSQAELLRDAISSANILKGICLTPLCLCL
jgi:hypothetical protein